MRYRCYFAALIKPGIIDYLNASGIRYEIFSDDFFRFTIFSDYPNAEKIRADLKEQFNYEPLLFPEYTAKELSEAKLLWLSPKRECIDIINGETAYAFSEMTIKYGRHLLAKHRWQIDQFAIAKEPPMGKSTAFWASDDGGWEVFTDSRVLALAKENNLVGVDYSNVFLKNGETSQNLFQLTPKNIISRECIGKGYREKVTKCPGCGKDIFVIGCDYQLYLDYSKIDLQFDLYVTERVFGDGIPFHLHLISQRFYQLLKQNNLVGSLNLSPVADISK